MKSTDNAALVNAATVMRRLGISPRTLDRMCADGRLHPLRTHTRGPRYFRPAEVDGLVERRSTLVASA